MNDPTVGPSHDGAGPSGSAVVIDGVSKQFTVHGRTSQALVDVALDAPRGEITSLVGPSGCGKSTVLNLIAGTIEPETGSVRHNGAPVVAINHDVAYLPQGDDLFPWRTVMDNVALPLELRRVSRAARHRQAREILALFGLAGRESSYPAQLSGGMRKRVQIARALLSGVDTLLMDEPFGALDAQLKVRMQIDLLERVHRQTGNTILFVTHDLAEAVALGDRVVVFSPGPGHVIHVENIDDLGDRSDLLSLTESPEFQRHVRTLWSLVAPELVHRSAASGATP
ncbi:ABC transporter ATP-binding protein [Rugosimonospora acidiphila]|uniref:ABC transporter ATP-binding protein n=1 Tax=Rugosimonospora acidiphila TaxID=556531 RepID=A0ABP9SNV5_9ACTN